MAEKRACRPVPASENQDGASCLSKTDYIAGTGKLQAEVKKKFQPKRDMSDALAGQYDILRAMGYPEIPRSLEARADRLRQCGTWLEFWLVGDDAKLHAANFCRDRLCPMCNWRRSLKTFAQASRIMTVLEREKYEFLFLTLTVRNCTGAEFKDTVGLILKGFSTLYRRTGVSRGKAPAVFGAFRALETTISLETRLFHPHLHVILAVKPCYWSDRYITQGKWAEMWRDVCGLDYNPVVWVEKVHPAGEPDKYGSRLGRAVAEVAKYPFKDAAWYNQRGEARTEAVRWLLHGLSNRQLVQMYGCFDRVRRELGQDDAEDGDLVHVDDDSIRPDVEHVIVTAHWRVGGYVFEISEPDDFMEN